MAAPTHRFFPASAGLSDQDTTLIDDRLAREERSLIERLVEIKQERASLGTVPGFDAFRSDVCGYELVTLLDKRLGNEPVSPEVCEELALHFDGVARWCRRGMK